MLRRPLRERIVLPIAVVPGFPDWIPLIAVEIPGQRRPLRFLQNNSVLYAGTMKSKHSTERRNLYILRML
ncbi:hypothetical protein PGLA_14520 [Paenibacillus glacialis]|uniref:Uncharacterized protein n=1 Tax=Paenibacillus glacialis TaxID=494026 RepID=A0A162K2F1_9BACL|nr:hypothetical protein PGLA_14520 [Paenibacillus glacialis]